MQWLGRLEPSIDPYFKGDIETDRFYYTSELTADPISYDVSSLPAGSIHDVWAVGPILGLLAWGKAYGSGLYGVGGYGLAPIVCDTLRYGIPVNSQAVTLRFNDGGSLSVAQHLATFLGSIRIADCGGKIKCHTSYGEAREWGIWNRHNQRKIILKGGATKPFTPDLVYQEYQYSPNWGPFACNASAHLKVFSGRSVSVDSWYHANAWLQEFGGHHAIIQGAIGWNSTDTPSGLWWQRGQEGYTGTGYIAGTTNCAARFIQSDSCGHNKIYPLIKTTDIASSSAVNDGTSVAMMWGEETRMLITAEWMG